MVLIFKTRREQNRVKLGGNLYMGAPHLIREHALIHNTLPYSGTWHLYLIWAGRVIYDAGSVKSVTTAPCIRGVTGRSCYYAVINAAV